MTICMLVIATLLSAPDAARSAQAPSEDRPRQVFMFEWEEFPRGKGQRQEFFFEWKQVPRWKVEIRGYEFHQGTLPPVKAIEEITINKVITSPLKPPTKPTEVLTIDAVEAFYVDDLPAFFKSLKQQMP
jgi:hypothetical protein